MLLWAGKWTSLSWHIVLLSLSCNLCSLDDFACGKDLLNLGPLSAEPIWEAWSASQHRKPRFCLQSKISLATTYHPPLGGSVVLSLAVGASLATTMCPWRSWKSHVNCLKHYFDFQMFDVHDLLWCGTNVQDWHLRSCRGSDKPKSTREANILIPDRLPNSIPSQTCRQQWETSRNQPRTNILTW